MKIDAAVRAALHQHAKTNSARVLIAHEKTTDRIYIRAGERVVRTDYTVKVLNALNSIFSPDHPITDEPRLVEAIRIIASYNKDALTIIGVDDYDTTIKGIVNLASFQKQMVSRG